MTKSVMSIFCFIIVGLFFRSLHCSLSFFVVTCVCIFQFREDTNCMPKYLYGSF